MASEPTLPLRIVADAAVRGLYGNSFSVAAALGDRFTPIARRLGEKGLLGNRARQGRRTSPWMYEPDAIFRLHVCRRITDLGFEEGELNKVLAAICGSRLWVDARDETPGASIVLHLTVVNGQIDDARLIRADEETRLYPNIMVGGGSVILLDLSDEFAPYRDIIPQVLSDEELPISYSVATGQVLDAWS